MSDERKWQSTPDKAGHWWFCGHHVDWKSTAPRLQIVSTEMMEGRLIVWVGDGWWELSDWPGQYMYIPQPQLPKGGG